MAQRDLGQLRRRQARLRPTEHDVRTHAHRLACGRAGGRSTVVETVPLSIRDQRVLGLAALLKRRGAQEGSIRCVLWACLVDEAYVRPTGRVHLHVVRLQGVKGGVNTLRRNDAIVVMVTTVQVAPAS